MTEKKPSRWGDQSRGVKRRDLTEEAAKKSGYPGDLRESRGWFRGARVYKRP